MRQRERGKTLAERGVIIKLCEHVAGRLPS